MAANFTRRSTWSNCEQVFKNSQHILYMGYICIYCLLVTMARTRRGSASCPLNYHDAQTVVILLILLYSVLTVCFYNVQYSRVVFFSLKKKTWQLVFLEMLERINGLAIHFNRERQFEIGVFWGKSMVMKKIELVHQGTTGLQNIIIWLYFHEQKNIFFSIATGHAIIWKFTFFSCDPQSCDEQSR